MLGIFLTRKSSETGRPSVLKGSRADLRENSYVLLMQRVELIDLGDQFIFCSTVNILKYKD